MKRVVWTLLLLIGVAGCTPLFGPNNPGFEAYGQTAVAVEEWYPEWEEILECAGPFIEDQTPPRGVFMVPPATDEWYAGFECGNPFTCWGLYRDGEVFVAEGLGGFTSGVVQHEMLHHLFWNEYNDGDGEHCSPLWALCGVANDTTCGSISRGEHDPDKEDE